MSTKPGSQSNEKVSQVQSLRSSNAAGPHKNKAEKRKTKKSPIEQEHRDNNG